MWLPLQAQAPEPHGTAAPAAEAMKAGVFEEASALPVLAIGPGAAPADSLPPEAQPAPGEPSRPDSQSADTVAADTVALRLQQLGDSVDSAVKLPAQPKTRFVPNPKRALWLSLVVPGAGQIYNRKYWKLPIIYGGFVGCAYALRWNNMMYKDYSQAYMDLMDNDPNTQSYNKFLYLGNQIDNSNKEYYQKLFKNRKDRYRKWRDMSVFAMVGVYLISVVDAYVDASLSEFDISRDLSMKVSPAVIKERSEWTSYNPLNSSAVGLQCSLTF